MEKSQKGKLIFWCLLGVAAIVGGVIVYKKVKASKGGDTKTDSGTGKDKDSENNSNTNTGSNTGTCSKEGKIFTDHDKTWDYKVEGCRWKARMKSDTSGAWKDIHDNAVAKQRLESKYGKI